MKNISGTFTLEICDIERELKCNFLVIEKLERQVLKRPILQALNEAETGGVYISDVVGVIHAGLEGARDTRLTRNEIGQYVTEKGMSNFLEFYLKFLTYALIGDSELKEDTEPETEDDKKKS